MKNLKKIIAAVLLTVMAMGVLTACGDPVASDFEKFLNTDMVDINANYDKLKEEMTKWDKFETVDEISNSVNNVILPNINDSMEKLAAITPETDEVKEIKAKYEKVLKTYKEGYEIMLDYCATNDDAKADEANTKIDEAIGYLNEYNAALEALAKEKDMQIEY